MKEKRHYTVLQSPPPLNNLGFNHSSLWLCTGLVRYVQIWTFFLKIYHSVYQKLYLMFTNCLAAKKHLFEFLQKTTTNATHFAVSEREPLCRKPRWKEITNFMEHFSICKLKLLWKRTIVYLWFIKNKSVNDTSRQFQSIFKRNSWLLIYSILL